MFRNHHFVSRSSVTLLQVVIPIQNVALHSCGISQVSKANNNRHSFKKILVWIIICKQITNFCLIFNARSSIFIFQTIGQYISTIIILKTLHEKLSFFSIPRQVKSNLVIVLSQLVQAFCTVVLANFFPYASVTLHAKSRHTRKRQSRGIKQWQRLRLLVGG